MIPGKEWLTVPQAARIMEMSRQGALKRLKKLNRKADDRLLQRPDDGSPWLVSVVVLAELSKVYERDRTIEGFRHRLDEVEVRLLALRNAHGRFRRVTAKRLDRHEEALNKMHGFNREVEEILGRG